jgi:hypothetical protein
MLFVRKPDPGPFFYRPDPDKEFFVPAKPEKLVRRLQVLPGRHKA